MSDPIQIRLDFKADAPIYEQIVEQVRQRIAGGALQPGDQLPTVRQLAAELRVNFNTIARAYRMLDEAGLISTQQGRGTYILEPGSGHNAAALREDILAGLAQRYIREAAQLGFSLDEIRQACETLTIKEQDNA